MTYTKEHYGREWYVYGPDKKWLASFTQESDADLFMKIKQINDILTS